MGERALTVRDRIVVHLSAFNRFADEFECPEEVCQSGISIATGKSRAHITLELNRMREADLVTERNAHVKGAKSKRKTYFLTSQGLARNAEINGFLESLKIEIVESGVSKILSGTDASEYLRANYRLSRVMAVEQVLASGGILKLEGAKVDSLVSRCQYLPPKQDDFLPRKEMEAILSAASVGNPETVVLLGIPGIGKTALLSEVAWTLESERSVFYKCIYPFDTARSIMGSIGDFLEKNGHPALLRYVKNAQTMDLPEAGTQLTKFLREKRAVLIFDDHDRGQDALETVFSMLAELIRGTGSALLVASSRRPGFYSIKSKSLDNRVKEIVLGPLDDDSSRLLLGGDKRNKSVKMAGGHPLMLKLFAAGAAPASLAGFVEDEMLGNDSEMSDLCRFASVLRKPFMPDELGAMGMRAAKDVRNSLVFEARNEGYVLHPAIASIILSSASERMLRDLHRRAVGLYEREPADNAEVLYHLLEAGDSQTAKKFVMEHGEGMLNSGNPEDIARSLERMLGKDEVAEFELLDIAAKAMNLAGRWPDAAKLARKAEREAPGTDWALNAGLLRANILSKTGKLKDALLLLGDIIESPENPGNALMAEAHCSAAIVLRKLGRNPAALEAAEMALELSGKNGDELLQARSLMESGMILSAMGKQDMARERLRRAAKYFDKLGNKPDVIRCGINTGILLRSMGRNEDAADALERSVKLAEEYGFSRFRAHGLVNLTDILNQIGEYQRSAELAREAADVFSGLGEPLMQTASMLNLGNALAGLGKKDEAIIVLDNAVSLLEDNGLIETRKEWLAECAEILNRMGEKRRAAAVLSKARKKKS